MSGISQFISNATLGHKSGKKLLLTEQQLKRQLLYWSEICSYLPPASCKRCLRTLYHHPLPPPLLAQPIPSWVLEQTGHFRLTFTAAHLMQSYMQSPRPPGPFLPCSWPAGCRRHPSRSSNRAAASGLLCLPGWSCPPFSDILSLLPSVHTSSFPASSAPTHCPCPGDFETKVHV